MNFQNLKKNATLQTVIGFKYAPRLDTSTIQGWAQLSSSQLLDGKKYRGPGLSSQQPLYFYIIIIFTLLTILIH